LLRVATTELLDGRVVELVVVRWSPLTSSS
jgi:hypothetical protein